MTVAEQKWYSDKISSIQSKLQNTQKTITDLHTWFRELPSDEKKRRREDYYGNLERYERDRDRYLDELRYAQEHEHLIAKGVPAAEVISYAQERTQADIQKTKQKKLMKDTLSPDEIKDIKYHAQLLKWGEKIGYEKLPSFAQTTLLDKGYLEKVEPMTGTIRDVPAQTIGTPPTPVFKVDKAPLHSPLSPTGWNIDLISSSITPPMKEDVSYPKYFDVVPKNIFSKTWESALAVSGATPAGIFRETEEQAKQRQEGYPLFKSVVQSREDVRTRKLDLLRGAYQVKKLEEFSETTGLDLFEGSDGGARALDKEERLKAGDLLKTSLEPEGELYQAGLRLEYVDEAEQKFIIKSPYFEKSQTGFDYIKSTLEDEPTRKKVGFYIATSAFKGLETYATIKLATATGIPAAFSRGTGALKMGVLGTTGKVLGHTLSIGGGTLIAGGIGYSTYQDYKTLSKEEFLTKTTGQALGLGLFLQDAGYGLNISKYTTPRGEVRVVDIAGKPLIVKSTITGKTSLGLPKKSPFGDKLPVEAYSTKVGATLARKYLDTTPFYKASDKELAKQLPSIVKQLRPIKMGEGSELLVSKSRYFETMKPEMQQAIISFFKKEGARATGVRGLFNAVFNRNLMKSYGSTVSASRGILSRQTADYDVLMTGRAIPKAESLYKILSKIDPSSVRLTQGTSLIEYKVGKSWVHLFDIHGIDTPDLALVGQPLGMKVLREGILKIGNQKVLASQAGQELTGKTASILQFREPTIIKLEGYTGAGKIITYPKVDKLPFKIKTYIAPEAHRIKDVGDAYEAISKMAIHSPTKINVPKLKILFEQSFGKEALTLGRTGATIFPSIPASKAAGLIAAPFILSPSPYLKSKTISFFSPLGYPSISKLSSLVPYTSYPSISRSYSLSSSISRPSASPSSYIPRYPSPSPSPSPSLYYPSPSPSLSPSPSSSPSPYYPSKISFLTGVPSFMFGGGDRKRAAKRKVHVDITGYQPSLTGSVLNLRLKKAPRFAGSLQIRGIID